jgi:hypothetical protein
VAKASGTVLQCEHGGDRLVSRRSQDGKTPLQLAQEKGFTAAVAVLVQAALDAPFDGAAREALAAAARPAPAAAARAALAAAAKSAPATHSAANVSAHLLMACFLHWMQRHQQCSLHCSFVHRNVCIHCAGVTGAWDSQLHDFAVPAHVNASLWWPHLSGIAWSVLAGASWAPQLHTTVRCPCAGVLLMCARSTQPDQVQQGCPPVLLHASCYMLCTACRNSRLAP